MGAHCEVPKSLCTLDKLEDPGACGANLDLFDETRRLFVVQKDSRLYAYINSCPHTGVPLNWQDDQFLSYDRRYIQCSLHGALFRIEDGACIAGPCPGTRLKSVPVKMENGLVVVDE